MPSQLSQSSAAIDDLAVKINELHHEAEKQRLRSAANQYFCGHGLCVVKKRLPHGEFQSWLESTFDGSQRTAHRYMQFYRILKKRGVKPDVDEFDSLLNDHGSVADVIRAFEDKDSPTDRNVEESTSVTKLPTTSESPQQASDAPARVEPASQGPEEEAPEVYVDAVAAVAKSEFGSQAVMSAFDDLLTGPEIRERVYRMGRVAIDPCSNCPTSPNIEAAVAFTEESDGLQEDWVGGLAYVHPPYFGIERWVNKTLQEIENKNIESAILLLPNQMETEWMAELDPYVRVVIREPITIVNERTGMQVSSARLPMVVVYVGSETTKFITLFSDLGTAFQRVLP